MRQLLLGVAAGGVLWVDFLFGIVFFAAAATIAARAYPRAIL